MVDLIDRQAAIQAMLELQKEDDDTYGCHIPEAFHGERAAKALKALPSAEPETAKRIVGKSRDGMTFWYQCDMCNEPVDAQDNFCRGCGRRLIDE